MKCLCGCGGEASWFVSGKDDVGPFVGEPCCDASMEYLKDAAAEFDLPFTKRRAPPSSTGGASTSPNAAQPKE